MRLFGSSSGSSRKLYQNPCSIITMLAVAAVRPLVMSMTVVVDVWERLPQVLRPEF